ncbi:MAG TPA: preprotein translocase subunit SecE [Chthonomonadaceae bacterium]|nr:preprotein translocase subunit SecE [Chthonomonadaceae bacterium]
MAKASEMSSGGGGDQSVQRAGNFLKETYEELRKTKWPTTREAWRLTYVVIAVIGALGVYMGVLDYLLSKIIESLSLLK